jgi:hypothetical protein
MDVSLDPDLDGFARHLFDLRVADPMPNAE